MFPQARTQFSFTVEKKTYYLLKPIWQLTNYEKLESPKMTHPTEEVVADEELNSLNI